jgi:dihydroneopterin aldolase/2-amino-4-hydroxy-6-hydroxymethyldihydropteridine diphosphokinase
MQAGDRISLTGVTAYGHHGVLEHERRQGQEFTVDVVMEVDLGRAADSDDLACTVDYAEVGAEIVAVITGPACDLIETLAGRIAGVVLGRSLVEAVEVTVHKPQAPVGVPFGDVTVKVRRERDVPVVIALGANLGDPAAALRSAGDRLRRVRGLRALRLSPLYRTEPVGGPEQPPYANAVALARTRLAPATLLTQLTRIEEDFGRTRGVRWGPRTLDLDLVQYGRPGQADEVRSAAPELTLPHPGAHERGFVLVPWLTLDPGASLRVGDAVVPVTTLLPAGGNDGVQPWPGDLGGQR